MTYLDKLMSTIKFDDKLLTATEIEHLRRANRSMLYIGAHPAQFPSLCCEEKTKWDDEVKE